ncbi:CynX/NimT family MFS transporter [Listeria costaricensis]|uniref:CynX/NimT family MFS transporter n=1 Tax=Listeria costaricensis TaxID=2026604 RepID=UPI001F090762|nr:MFS transporter [Listeria costaricensis]
MTDTKAARNGLLICGILLIAANLRMPITSLSPLLPFIKQDAPVSSAFAGFLTTLPLLAFALVSPFVSGLSRRFGMRRILFFALIILSIGSFIRPFGGLPLLLMGTLLIGFAIAAGNVLVPSLIKQEFPFRLGLMTGLYSIVMNLSAAVSSGLSVPLAETLPRGWQGSLLTFACFSLVALLFWLPQIRQNRERPLDQKTHDKQAVNVWRSPLAWMITVLMGMQSLIFYVAVAWLPEIMQSRGLLPAESGWMLTILQIGIMPTTFIAPMIAARMKDQRLLVGLAAGFLALGTTGLLFANDQFWLDAVIVLILGIGSGLAFSLAMMFFNLRTRTAETAADLSGMAQSIGYLLAAIGPTLFGVLHDISGHWNGAIVLFYVATLLILFCGLKAGRNRVID